MSNNIGIYPGTFDPITNGHLDIIKRAMIMFDKLYITISNNTSKKTLFTLEERIDILKSVTKEYSNVEIVVCNELTVNFAKKIGARFLVRGLRAVTDFEYELQMAHTNRKIESEIDTVFLMTSSEYSYLSSSLIKEIAKYNGDISKFVHPEVADRIKNKL